MCWLYDYLNATVMTHFVFFFFLKKKKKKKKKKNKKKMKGWSNHGPPDMIIQGRVFRSLEKVSSRDKHKGLGI
jgi:hypothetical protein